MKNAQRLDEAQSETMKLRVENETTCPMINAITHAKWKVDLYDTFHRLLNCLQLHHLQQHREQPKVYGIPRQLHLSIYEISS